MTEDNGGDPIANLNEVMKRLATAQLWLSAAGDALSREGRYSEPVRDEVAHINRNLGIVLQQITDLKHAIRQSQLRP